MIKSEKYIIADKIIMHYYKYYNNEKFSQWWCIDKEYNRELLDINDPLVKKILREFKLKRILG